MTTSRNDAAVHQAQTASSGAVADSNSPPAPQLTPPSRSYTEPVRSGGNAPRHSIVELAGKGTPEPVQEAIPSNVPSVSRIHIQTKANRVDGSSTAAAAPRYLVSSAEPSSFRDRFGFAGFFQHRTKKRRHKMHGVVWRDKARERVAAIFQAVIVEGLFRRKPLPPSIDGRHIPLHQNPSADLIDERSGRRYCGNFIVSSRYTLYDFVPKQLLFQFSKLGNFYFLVMGILQTIPGLSTVGRWTTIGPLSIFIAFSVAKEGLDDYRRYQLDKSENRSAALVLDRGNDRKRHTPQRKTTARRFIQMYQKETVFVEELAMKDREESPGMDTDWLELDWSQVRVGDVVRLQRDQDVPADMVLLHATGPNGIAYIETMALDGETNLKAKQACPPLAKHCATVAGLRSTHATVVSEDPNLDLYSYQGRVTVDGETWPLSLGNVVYRGSTLRNTSEAIGLVINSGEECKIRMNAHRNVRTKKPAMQSAVNKMILFQILIVIMLAVGFTVGYYLWEERVENRSFYIYQRGVYDSSVPLKHIFFGYLVMFNTLIPLSLYISLEIVKLGQLYLLQDVEMYDPVSDTPMVANTMTIIENLGQVTHVFSDKTGTLTENLMRLRKFSIAGVSVLHDMDVLRDETSRQHNTEYKNNKDISRSQGKQRERALEGSSEPVGRASTGSFVHWKPSVRLKDEPDMKTEDVIEYIRSKPNAPFSRQAKHFLLCIALCHTCLPERKEDGSIAFQAASPDELALVQAAQDLGYMLMDRPAQSIKLQTVDASGNSVIDSYQVLDVIEFSSQRKRMSIIVRMPDSTICVICKGADNVVTSRLRLSHLAEQKARDIGHRASMRKTFEKNKIMQRRSMQVSLRSSPRNSLTAKMGDSVPGLAMRQRTVRCSADGLVLSRLQRRRTEDLSSARFSVDVLKSARHSHNAGRVASLDIIDGCVDETAATSDAAMFEKCFQHVDDFATQGLRTLLYGYRYLDEDTYDKWKAQYRAAETSLVDRQQRIEEAGDLIEHKLELAGAVAIEDKLQAGVPETIDKLYRANIRVWMLTGDKRETAINIAHSAHVCKPYSETYVLDVNADAGAGSLADQLTMTLTDVSRGMAPHTVAVVDGQTLSRITGDEDLSVLFHDLAVRVDSVICCRASPAQKADLVRTIRRRVPGSMTLAVGDGANDIGMIQASHVGIGISGREGLQAARMADYSIARFRFLQRLLLVHGRWNYLRTGGYVLATFWKEIFFSLLQAHFQPAVGYTGTSLFQSTSLAVFNTLFTSLAVILPAILERDLAADTLLAAPELYTFGQRGGAFNHRLCAGWMVAGTASSLIVYHVAVAVHRPLARALPAEHATLYALGTLCFTAAVLLINAKLLLLELRRWTVVTLAGLVVTLAGWFLWLVLLSVLPAAPREASGPYPVRDALTRAFGAGLPWWAALLLVVAAPAVVDVVVHAVARVFCPSDRDLMQRLEKELDARQIRALFSPDTDTTDGDANDVER